MVIFITGAANGIGQCLAQTLFGQGHSLALTDIAYEPIRQQWHDDRVLTMPLDVRQIEQWQLAIEKTAEKFGRIDVILNVAGVIVPGFVKDFNFKDIDFQIDINLKGVLYGSKLMADFMLIQGGGQIINIASLAGVAPIKGLSLYSASKFGVRAFSIAIAQELKPHNIAVSVVCPDLIDTKMLTDQLAYEAANLTFSTDRVIPVQEITDVIIKKALIEKKLEVLYPIQRGILAKLGNLIPQLGPFLSNYLTKKGEKLRKSLHEKRANLT